MIAFFFPKQKYPLELFIFPDPFSPFTVSEAGGSGHGAKGKTVIPHVLKSLDYPKSI